MKNLRVKFCAFMLTFLLSSVLNASEQATIDSTLQESYSSSQFIQLNQLRSSFQNYQDPRTLKIQKKGTLIFSWTDVQNEGSIIAIKYQEYRSTVWQEILIPATENQITIDKLPENKIYRYYIGTGADQFNLLYNTQEAYFNTFSPNLFQNNQADPGEEEAIFKWGINRETLNGIVTLYPEAHYIIKYNTKIGADQNANDPSRSPWKIIRPIDINEVDLEQTDLIGGGKYVYKLGLHLSENQTIWAEKKSFQVERTWGIFKLLVLIGALGLFIFGMKTMSEGLQQVAGSRLRNWLGSITSNRVSGVFTGFGITSIVQSSSVTTVMTVSFVNAGLMTLRQSAGVMMGANIGTTLTAWLILLFGFKVSLDSYALIFIAFGAPLLFFSKSKLKSWSSAIIGFALLFMGLGFLKNAVPDLDANSALVQFFVDFKDAWYAPVMFVFLGALVTVVIQSSSAAMALTMTLVANNVIPFQVALAMILGENIGTTITAEIASLVGNVHAKRSARIHSLFNVIGVTWAILLFPVTTKLLVFFLDGNPYEDGDVANQGLAIFHTAFNLLNVVLLIGFVPWLVKVATRTVKSRGASDEEFKLDYIGTGMMGTSDISILEAKKEVAKFGEITSRMSRFTQNILNEQNKKEKIKIHTKIKKYEEITDRVEAEVSNYLAKVSEGEMSEQTAKRVRSMNSIVNDLERIGDIFYQMSKTIERKDERKLYLLPEQRTNLMEMFVLVDNAFIIMVDNLNANWDGVLLTEAREAEDAINAKRNAMRQSYLENLSKRDFNFESGIVYSELFSSCEKVGDHIINVSEAVTGKV